MRTVPNFPIVEMQPLILSPDNQFLIMQKSYGHKQWELPLAMFECSDRIEEILDVFKRIVGMSICVLSEVVVVKPRHDMDEKNRVRPKIIKSFIAVSDERDTPSFDSSIYSAARWHSFGETLPDDFSPTSARAVIRIQNLSTRTILSPAFA